MKNYSWKIALPYLTMLAVAAVTIALNALSTLHSDNATTSLLVTLGAVVGDRLRAYLLAREAANPPLASVTVGRLPLPVEHVTQVVEEALRQLGYPIPGAVTHAPTVSLMRGDAITPPTDIASMYAPNPSAR